MEFSVTRLGVMHPSPSTSVHATPRPVPVRYRRSLCPGWESNPHAAEAAEGFKFHPGRSGRAAPAVPHPLSWANPPQRPPSPVLSGAVPANPVHFSCTQSRTCGRWSTCRTAPCSLASIGTTGPDWAARASLAAPTSTRRVSDIDQTRISPAVDPGRRVPSDQISNTHEEAAPAAIDSVLTVSHAKRTSVRKVAHCPFLAVGRSDRPVGTCARLDTVG